MMHFGETDSLNLIDRAAYLDEQFDLEEVAKKARKLKRDLKKGTRMSHELGTEIFYMQDNVVKSGKILAIMSIQNDDNWPHSNEDDTVNSLFGASGVFYGTKHGEFSSDKVFLSTQDLFDNLIKTAI